MINESVTDVVQRLTQTFRRGTKEDVISEIQTMTPARIATVSVRIYQNLQGDDYLQNVFARALESRTYREGEVWEVWDEKYHGPDCITSEVVMSGTWQECREHLGPQYDKQRFSLHQVES